MLIPLQTAPYLQFARRLLSGPGTIESVAYKTEVLCPEETVSIRPAMVLPGQVDRITATSPYCVLKEEVEGATSTIATHAATIAYHVKGAALLDGYIYTGSAKLRITPKSLFDAFPSKQCYLRTAALTSSYAGTMHFYHWLADDCLQYLLAESIGKPLAVRAPGSAEGHKEKYATYFGQDWTPIDRAWIEHLTVFQDYAQNSLKQNRYKILRSRIKERFPGNGRGLCVYLRRGQTGIARLIQNEDEIINALAKRGFALLDIASDSLEHIIGTLVDAKLVISMEGSHIAHCVFALPEKSGLIVLEPPDRFMSVHRHWSECLDIRFGFVVGFNTGVGYRFSSSEVLQTIDLMLRQLTA